jgi:transcriptional regulator with XRE-family HTH domain
MVNMTNPSDYVAARIREVRRAHGLSIAQLAAKCSQLGAPQLTPAVLDNIETGRRNKDGGRRRHVTVDELLAVALALNAPPLYLIIPPDYPDEPYPVTSTEALPRHQVAAWFTGTGPILPSMASVGDTRRYYAERPINVKTPERNTGAPPKLGAWTATA